jgi:HKD family nuclease
MFDMIEMLGHSGYDLRSSIILTYGLDLPLYDGLIRRALNRAGVWNQITFCDFSCYLQDIQSQTAAPYAGKHYSVTPIWQLGAFHPKVYMLLGPRRGRLLVGSGNTTIGGLIRNAEVFGLFDFDAEKEKEPQAAFSTVFGLVEELATRASDTVRKQIKSARQMAPWLASSFVEDGRKVLIGGPGRPELLTQIIKCLPTTKADGLVVCSSSFDRDLCGVSSLVSSCKSKPACIVQPEQVELDGKAVQKLGGKVDWYPFVDPYPPEKRQRKDVRAHAKMLIFGHGKTETCVYGSANASEPALNSTNTEIVVVLPPRDKGDFVKHLGLDASLNANNIEAELSKKQWVQNKKERPESRFSCLLSAVAAVESGYRLSFAFGAPPEGSHLALSDRNLGRPKATTLIHGEGESFVALSIKSDEAIRFGWVAKESGEALSNAVAITWPTVANPRKPGGGGTKTSEYLGAMQDGAVLGTVLFELLDQFRDFEVIQAGSVRRISSKKESPGDGKPPEERSAEFFYTDAKADAITGHHWTGDRIDLDILASLVQPLVPEGTAKQAEDDDAYDDSKLDEEAERRQIEAKKGKATGEEKPQVEATPSKKFAAATKRLEHRLDRAAKSIEDSLQYLDNMQNLAPNGVARQIWMTHIGAFLAGRITESAEGDKFVCLQPWNFAQYVLRVCRALAGSKKVGGFLDRLATSSWEGFDGEALVKGLSFLWTCGTWAAAYMVHYYSNGDGKQQVPKSIAVAAAELVAARFIWKASIHCKEADCDGLERRFPGWKSVPARQLDYTTKRLQEVAQLIERVEASGDKALLGTESDASVLKAGHLVHNPSVGVTMLAKDGVDQAFYLVNLSKSGDDPKKFGRLVVPVLFHGKHYRLFQRTDESSAA